MLSIPAKDISHSAIKTGHWLLSCLALNDKERYDILCLKFKRVFQTNELDEETFYKYLECLNDVFGSLIKAQSTGFISLLISLNDGKNECKIDRHISDLIGNSHDYITFLFVFANYLDKNQKCFEKFVLQTINFILNLQLLDTNDKTVELSELQMKGLMIGYNFLNSSSINRENVFIKIIQFAVENKIFVKLIPYIYKSTIDLGFMNLKNRCHIYSLVVSELKKLPKNKQNLLNFLMQINNEFEKDIRSISSIDYEVEVFAVELLKLSVQLVEFVTFDEILNLKSVQILKQTDHCVLLELITIFQNGTQKDFKAFVVNHPNIFKDYELDENSCYEKMQLLALATNVIDKDFNQDKQNDFFQIPIDDISKHLQISSDQVQNLAVKAIVLGVFNGRIDQLNHVIAVKSGLSRCFLYENWELLRDKIINLSDNINYMIEQL